MKTVRRWIPEENLHYLPKGVGTKIRRGRDNMVLYELDVHFVQHKHGKYKRLIERKIW